MTDVYGPEKRSAVMRRVKGAGTTPELAVRRLIWGLGGRYRLNRKDLPITRLGLRQSSGAVGLDAELQDFRPARIGRCRA